MVLHATLPPDKITNMGIVKLFAQGNGDVIKFPQTGFSAHQCFVNGTERNLADYLAERKIDTGLPLFAGYCGAIVKLCFQTIDKGKKPSVSMRQRSIISSTASRHQSTIMSLAFRPHCPR